MSGEQLKMRFEESYVPEPLTGCWLWTKFLQPNGYARVQVQRHPRRVTMPAHRLSWELTFGPVPPGLFVLHKCDVRACVNPDHLFIGTQADNMQDCSRKGRLNWQKDPGLRRRTAARGEKTGAYTMPERHPRGERHGCHKLTEDGVHSIRQRAELGESQASLAAAFGVVQGTVGFVVRRETWRHVA